ncbi:hypothetical protein LINPERPRIM_LOCUS32204 [Linum perenne]
MSSSAESAVTVFSTRSAPAEVLSFSPLYKFLGFLLSGSLIRVYFNFRVSNLCS